MFRTNYPGSIFPFAKRRISVRLPRAAKLLIGMGGIVLILLVVRYLLYDTRPVMLEQEQHKTAYLTFDDGPSWVTAKVLEVLAKKNIKATFFLIGNEITEDDEDLIRQMVAEGHAIGIHTYCHKKDQIYCSAEALLEDIEKTYDRIYEITGEKPVLYRFPWGSVNCYMDKNLCEQAQKRISDMGLTYHDWNVSGEDSVGTPTTYSILHSIKQNFTKYEEPVILLHDSKINELTSQVLPQIIEMMEAEGYTFDTLDHRSEPCQYTR